MAYIGKTPTVGNFVKLDALTASATASYTMQVDSVNFSPESVNHMLVSLNGVIQSPTTSYTISGSTLTFASALTSSDSIDFIMVYGNVLDIGTPSDATVTNAKTNFVSTSSAAGLQIKGDGTTDGTLQLNCSQNSHGIKLKSPAHSASASYTLTFPTTDGSANEFLKTDGSGVLSWASAGGGKILQVGHVVSTTAVNNTSTSSYADGNLTLNFTPTASSSTVLLFFQLSVMINHTTSQDASTQIKIFRDTTEIYNGGSTQNYHSASSNGNVRYSTPIIYVDSPSTASQVTYTYDFKNPHSTQEVKVSDNSSPSTLTAFEIGA